MSVVVSDTSPLHYLILCGVATVLARLFERVIIPPTVFAELQHPNTPAPVQEWMRTLPAWVAVQKPGSLNLSLNVDAGELEAICLAQEIGATALLMDDQAGRRAAAQLGLPVIGTLGLLEQSAMRGWIDLPLTLERLRETNARLDSARALIAPEFHEFAHVPPATEWFANIENPNTRRAYKNDLKEFMTFIGIAAPAELRLVTRAHVLAWRRDLERRELADSTIRRKLAALSSLFEYLCDQNSVATNPIKGVKRPKDKSYEGKTPALGDSQARHLMKLPAGDNLKASRDRALLSLLLHHGLRREELSSLKIHDVHLRRSVPHLRVHGKGGKMRYIPLHPGTQGLLADYLEASGHSQDKAASLFRPIRNNRTGELERGMSTDGIYKLVRGYAQKLGVTIGAHALRATAAINALEHEADIVKVQEWLGHANIATTRLYDRRKNRSQDSPTFKVSY